MAPSLDCVKDSDTYKVKHRRLTLMDGESQRIGGFLWNEILRQTPHEAGARFHEKKTGPFLTLPFPSRGKHRG